MKNVIREIDGFYSNKVDYGDTDNVYFHKKHWSTLADNGFVGDFLGNGINNYGNAGIFYAWFLAPKVRYCLAIIDYGVISFERSFKGYSEEDRCIRLDDFISLTEEKTLCGRFSDD